MNDLILIHDNDSTFLDYSRKLDLLRDDFEITFTNSTDYLYLGLYKEFSQVYVELKEVSIEQLFPEFEYFNGNTWLPITTSDDTFGFLRSGFLKFERPTDWITTNIDGKIAHFIRIKYADSVLNFAGIDMVFADDHDLKTEFRDVLDYIAKDDISLIAYHVAARNEIVNTMRVGGMISLEDRKDFSQFSKWDFLNPLEIKQAATYLALSKLMFDVSQNNDDKFYIRYREYVGKFSASFKLAYMALDKNDNGKADDLMTEYEGRTFKV